MRVSGSWLKDWVSGRLDPAGVAEKLTLAGLEVEAVTPAGLELDPARVVVAQVLEVAPHPHAGRLRVCRVDAGRGAWRSVVCGAPNLRPGMKSVLALPGARLPEMQVKSALVRGVRSAGMLCSSAEIGLDERADGIMELDPDAPVGAGIRDYLDLNDSIFHLELTPNRGDCLGTLGVAREVAALTGARLRDRGQDACKPETTSDLEVKLESPAACPRYVGRAVRDVDVSARTPDWMAERLRRCGLRGINVVVDVTNYVMHELGQPMHAFDMDRINGLIRVRQANRGERLKLLNGDTVKLDESNLVIADREQAIALAGIMGGYDSAVSGDTRNIYLESAFFAQSAIQGRARRLGMHTDASHRYERGVDSEMQVRAMERATQLLLETAGGKAGPITHARSAKHLPKKRSIRFDPGEVRRILGDPVPPARCRSMLERLGMKVSPAKTGMRVRIPSWRFDVSGPHDLVEEIGRCHGFDRFTPRMPPARPRPGAHDEAMVSESALKDALVDLGYHEAITYSFVDPAAQRRLLGRDDAIRLKNPIADNLSVMRQSLWPGLLEALRNNLNRQEGRVRLFETGHVFLSARNDRKSREIHRLGMLVYGPGEPLQWGAAERGSDFYDLKGDLEFLFSLCGGGGEFSFQSGSHAGLHPGQCAKILRGKTVAGHLGALHPDVQDAFEFEQPVFLAELDVDRLARSTLPVFEEISRFPAVRRDLSIVVDEGVEVDSLLRLVRGTAGDRLKKLELFDVYQGGSLKKNCKSLAFSLTFQSESSSLESSEVEAETDRIVQALAEAFGARLRAS